jgi:hypothetical protein
MSIGPQNAFSKNNDPGLALPKNIESRIAMWKTLFFYYTPKKKAAFVGTTRAV